MNGHPKRYAQLTARLADLDRRMHKIEEELQSPHSADWDDSGTEREGDEVLEGMGLSSQREAAMIRAALERIEVGTYGICVKCGAPISNARLDIVPYTPFCSACAA
jgi:RNA polymerase-binding transcription factor DksA